MFRVLRLKNLLALRPALSWAMFLIFVQCGYAAANEPEQLEAGFHHMYNLDFQGAHAIFETFQELRPEDPMGHAANAAAYLFGEFERLHVLNLRLFTGNKELESRGRQTLDPAIKLAFETELTRAEELASRALERFPEDRNALFAKVLVDGLKGDHAALVEKRSGEGLKFLKASRVTAEKLIELDPDCYDAYMAVGLENYLLGLQSAPKRWFLRLSGAQTSKEKGIAKLKVTAERGRYLAPYARLLLAVAAIRDKDHKTARSLLSNLAHEFPRNRLYQVELARLAD